MKNQVVPISIMFAVVLVPHPQLVAAKNQPSDLTEAMKQSIVYLKTSSYG